MYLQIATLLNSNVDGFVLWTPINASQIQLIVYTTTFVCIGIDFYGCTYNEGL